MHICHQVSLHSNIRLPRRHLQSSITLCKIAQFLDYGRHSEAVELRWVLDRDDAGRPVARRLERAVLAPPRPRHVPHFGCVLGSAAGC